MTAQLTKQLENTMQQSVQTHEQLEDLKRQLMEKDGTIEGLMQSVGIEKTISDTGTNTHAANQHLLLPVTCKLLPPCNLQNIL